MNQSELASAWQQQGFSRRRFLIGSAVALGTVGVAGWVGIRIADGAPVTPIENPQRLTPGMQSMFWHIGDAILDGVLESDENARHEQLGWIVTNIDNAMTGLPVKMQADTLKLLKLLSSAPTRLLVGSQWTGWGNLSREEIVAEMNRLRASETPLQNIIYRVLRELVVGQFYGDRRSWTVIGYPGPVIDFEKARA